MYNFLVTEMVYITTTHIIEDPRSKIHLNNDTQTVHTRTEMYKHAHLHATSCTRTEIGTCTHARTHGHS